MWTTSRRLARMIRLRACSSPPRARRASSSSSACGEQRDAADLVEVEVEQVALGLARAGRGARARPRSAAASGRAIPGARGVAAEALELPRRRNRDRAAAPRSRAPAARRAARFRQSTPRGDRGSGAGSGGASRSSPDREAAVTAAVPRSSPPRRPRRAHPARSARAASRRDARAIARSPSASTSTAPSARLRTRPRSPRPRARRSDEVAEPHALDAAADQSDATRCMRDNEDRARRAPVAAKEMVGARGFEPPTPWSRTRCSTRLSHAPTC